MTDEVLFQHGTTMVRPQLYRMYRESPEKLKQQKSPNMLRLREKEWSGREDLNLRPPGPELRKRVANHCPSCRYVGLDSWFVAAVRTRLDPNWTQANALSVS